MPVDKVDGYTNQCGTSEPNGAPINITFKFQYTCNGGTCPNDVTGKIKYMFYGNGTGSNVNNNIREQLFLKHCGIILKVSPKNFYGVCPQNKHRFFSTKV